jgi:hypothetical protein
LIVPITLLAPLANWEQGLLALLLGASAISLIRHQLRNRERRHGPPEVRRASTSAPSSPDCVRSLSMPREDKKANSLDERDRPQPHATDQFSQLCESIKDAPPEEQASRLRQHFGVFGGARPGESRRRQF